MLYLIGLGLNPGGISKYGLAVAKKCKKVYFENYTVEFPYSIGELKEILGKKLIPADRKFIESFEIIGEAERMDVALLVYGSPLTATTHVALIQKSRQSKIRYKVIYNASILDAVAETGLQIYKFGKVASMPKWEEKKNFIPDSFMEIIKQNESIKAHSLVLVDIGLKFAEAIQQLKKASQKYNVKLKKIIVCQALETKKRKILYRNFTELEEFSGISPPYSFIIPSKLHFVEKEFLETIEKNSK